MRAWLLRSRQGRLTCGHLHDREADAWRCLGLQADPICWSVASTWLSVVGVPPKHDAWTIAGGLCLLVPLAAGIVAGLVNMIHSLWAWDLAKVSFVALAVLFLGVTSCMIVALVIDASRHPSSSGPDGRDSSPAGQ